MLDGGVDLALEVVLGMFVSFSADRGMRLMMDHLHVLSMHLGLS